MSDPDHHAMMEEHVSSGLRIQDAYEQGFNLFKQQPDLTLGEVAWLGPKSLNEAIDFLEGYKAARRQHDEFKRERRE